MQVGAASPREIQAKQKHPRFCTARDHLGSEIVIGNNVNESWVQFSGSRNEALRDCHTMVSSRGRKRAFLTARKWIHFEKSLIFLSGSCEDDHIGQRIFVYKIKERIPIVKACPSVSGCVLNVKTNILILKRKKDISDRKERRGPCKYSCRDFSDLTTSLRTLRPQYTNKAQSWLSGRGVALQKP